MLITNIFIEVMFIDRQTYLGHVVIMSSKSPESSKPSKPSKPSKSTKAKYACRQYSFPPFLSSVSDNQQHLLIGRLSDLLTSSFHFHSPAKDETDLRVGAWLPAESLQVCSFSRRCTNDGRVQDGRALNPSRENHSKLYLRCLLKAVPLMMRSTFGLHLGFQLRVFKFVPRGGESIMGESVNVNSCRHQDEAINSSPLRCLLRNVFENVSVKECFRWVFCVLPVRFGVG